MVLVDEPEIMEPEKKFVKFKMGEMSDSLDYTCINSLQIIKFFNVNYY